MDSNLTLEEMEREAYQRGEVERAALLALAADRVDPEAIEDNAYMAIVSIEELIRCAVVGTARKVELVTLVRRILKECRNVDG